MEWLWKALLDPDKLTAWVSILLAVVALVKAIIHVNDGRAEEKRLSKWEIIKAFSTDFMLVVERMAKETPTKKDDEYVERVKQLGKAFGFTIEPHEVQTVKDIGTAAKEAFKVSQVVPLADPLEGSQ